MLRNMVIQCELTLSVILYVLSECDFCFAFMYFTVSIVISRDLLSAPTAGARCFVKHLEQQQDKTCSDDNSEFRLSIVCEWTECQ